MNKPLFAVFAYLPSALRSIRLPPLLLAALLGAWASFASATLPISHWTAPSGARVYFVQASAIPMLDISVSFDAGDRFDPPGRGGLAALTAALLAKGADGADEDAISAAFAAVGAQKGGQVGDDRTTVSLRTLSSEAESSAALAMLERVLARPMFPSAVLAREQARMVQSLRDAQTRPEVIAQQTFRRLLYPAHPYGVFASPDSVAAIARDDLLRFHGRHYAASRAVVAMIGDISQERAASIAQQLTARLPTGETPPSMPPVVRLTTPVVSRVPHPATQSHILIGAPGIAWGDPDQFALLVGNYVLGGGGFVSRLYDRVREQRGLAYSVHAQFSPALQPGPFTISLQTQRAQTETALAVVRETVAAFLAEGPTDAEVAAAKANLIGGFALRIDSNAKILAYLSTIGFHRLPLDYLDRWTDQVAAVDAARIRAAFARVLGTGAMATVVVGGDAQTSVRDAARTAPGQRDAGATAPVRQ